MMVKSWEGGGGLQMMHLRNWGQNCQDAKIVVGTLRQTEEFWHSYYDKKKLWKTTK